MHYFDLCTCLVGTRGSDVSVGNKQFRSSKHNKAKIGKKQSQEGDLGRNAIIIRQMAQGTNP